MSLIKSILVAMIFLAATHFLPAAEPSRMAERLPDALATASDHAEPAEHGIPQKAEPLFHDEFFITNSMVVTWIVALGLILFARLATRQMQEVPREGGR